MCGSAQHIYDMQVLRYPGRDAHLRVLQLDAARSQKDDESKTPHDIAERQLDVTKARSPSAHCVAILYLVLYSTSWAQC